MNPQQQFCPNSACHASGKAGEGNIVIHSQKERRYKCNCCSKTFSESKGTAVYGLKKPVELFVLVVTLLVHGCPKQAIVAAFGLDERTVTSWFEKAGAHGQVVHQELVGQAKLDLQQVQADEIKVKIQSGTVWMALALMVPTRLWLGGVVSPHRDLSLIRALMAQVRTTALCRPLLIAVDGLASYVRAAREAFRTPLHTGKPGRPRLVAWQETAIVQVVKSRRAGNWSLNRRIVQGSQALVSSLIAMSQPQGTINTAYIERFNATVRQRLAPLARRTRSLARLPQTLHAGMFLLGCVYNFCTDHTSLQVPIYLGYSGQKRHLVQRTPAMAAGLTDHRWTISELLLFKVPTTFQPPKRRGRLPRLSCSCCGFS